MPHLHAPSKLCGRPFKVADGTATTGRLFLMLGLRHATPAFRRACMRSKCTRRQTVVESRKLEPKAGRLKLLSAILASLVTSARAWLSQCHGASRASPTVAFGIPFHPRVQKWSLNGNERRRKSRNVVPLDATIPVGHGGSNKKHEERRAPPSSQRFDYRPPNLFRGPSSQRETCGRAGVRRTRRCCRGAAETVAGDGVTH